MNKFRVPFAQVRSQVIDFDGGINENVSSLSLKPGELINGLNYQLTEGSEGGYASIKGYERYDGQTAPSSIDATPEDDTAREAARTAIGEVPGEGEVLGIWLYLGKLYAFRNDVGGAEAKMYVESAAGWVEVTTTFTLLASGSYDFVNYNFSLIDADKRMWWVDSSEYVYSFDGTTVERTTSTDFSSLLKITTHIDRLWVSDEKGGLFYSGVYQDLVAFPSWDATDGAGRKDFGFKITDIIQTVGNALIIFGDENTSVVKGSTDITQTTIETFSPVSGAIEYTAKRMLGTTYFVDDRGFTSLEAVDAFGDFSANSLTERVKKLIVSNLEKITTSVASRLYNQYRLYFDNGVALYFSFLNKELVGTTTIKYPIAVLNTIEGRDEFNDTVIYFSSEDGYIYKMDSGTSFDGEPVKTLASTAYYHYKYPRNWKRFHRATLEVACSTEIEVSFRVSFDYGASGVPRSITTDFDTPLSGGIYSEGVWGTMVYGGPTETNRITQYIEGIGSNMSMSFRSESAFSEPHTIQNAIIDYELLGRQQ